MTPLSSLEQHTAPSRAIPLGWQQSESRTSQTGDNDLPPPSITGIQPHGSSWTSRAVLHHCPKFWLTDQLTDLANPTICHYSRPVQASVPLTGLCCEECEMVVTKLAVSAVIQISSLINLIRSSPPGCRSALTGQEQWTPYNILALSLGNL